MSVVGTDIYEAVRLIREGDVVAIPTETVYGLAADAENEKAIERVFAIKGRPRKNPLIVHLAEGMPLSNWVSEIPDKAELLMKAFWPGPLTLVLPRAQAVSSMITSGRDTVAIRIPAHRMTRELLRAFGGALVAPSANPSNYISPTTAEHVSAQLGKQIPYVLDGGPCMKGLESTIIAFPDGIPTLLRYGSISKEEIEAVIGPLATYTQSSDIPAAPGMMKKHYSPRTPLLLVDDIVDAIENAQGAIGILCHSPKEFADSKVLFKETLSRIGDIQEAAKELYSAMHRLDRRGLDVILAERFPDEGLGKAINDRLERAAHD